MSILGLDIGSVAISAVLMNRKREIIKQFYAFHHGKARLQLAEMLAQFDISTIEAIAVTSTTPAIVHYTGKYDAQISVIRAVKEKYENPGSILFIGGENFGLITFDSHGNYESYRTNTSCAAGTGSFLDQQATRLNLKSIQSLSELAFCNVDEIPEIATRCAVFAKTDLIHAQQEGFSVAQISDGLCKGMAKNIVNTLVPEEIELQSPVIVAGGVSMNEGVMKHIDGLLQKKSVISEYSLVYGATGAALLYIDEHPEELTSQPSFSIDSIVMQSAAERTYAYPPLELKLSEYPDFSSLDSFAFSDDTGGKEVEIDIYNLPSDYPHLILGVDIGSTSTKTVLISSEDGTVVAGLYTRTSGDPLHAIKVLFKAIEHIGEKYAVSFEIHAAATTGSGRNFIGKIIGADLIVDEITAHARAAYSINPEVDTIIEIGGQDAKFTTMQNGMVTSSTMNSVCAAGTGSFIEEQAEKLDCEIRSYAQRVLGVKAPAASDRCTVFMERDLNYYLSEGYEVNEILAAVLHSVRENYLTKVATVAAIGDHIMFQGATAKNKALIAAFEYKLQKPITVSKYCHLTGALGAALLAKESLIRQTTFRGIELYHQEMVVKTEICHLCDNACKIKKIAVGDEEVSFGYLCGRDGDASIKQADASGFNLLKERIRIFESGVEKKVLSDEIVIGIPSALYLEEDAYLWKYFFNILGFKTRFSHALRKPVARGKKLVTSEFCAPMVAFHGDVDYIAEKSDIVFLPVYLASREKEKNRLRQFCYSIQFSTPLVLSALSEEKHDKIVSPVVDHRKFQTKINLYMALKKVLPSVGYWAISSAYERADELFKKRQEELQNLFERESSNAKDVNILFLGRPYNVLDRRLNKDIPTLFNNHGVKTFFQDMLPYSEEDVAGIDKLLDAFHWKYVAKIMESAFVAAQTDNLYPVYVTSFKCSPDSYGLEYFKKIMNYFNKPYLILETDEHDSNVGYGTRIEAAVRTFRNHAAKKQKPARNESVIINPEVKLQKDVSSVFTGKTLLLPSWDTTVSRLIEAVFIKEGIDARTVYMTKETIKNGAATNTGQCLPQNMIYQGFADYIKKHHLDPKETVLWFFDASIACNIRMYPYFAKTLLENHGKGLGDVTVYSGEVALNDISIQASVDAYFAYFFGGMLRKIATHIRPYEVNKGETDSTVEQATEIFYRSFLSGHSKDDGLERVVRMFEKIKVDRTKKRTKVAIFGDMYVRDNEMMNQNLVKTIEDAGGEVLTTPYVDIVKLMFDSYVKRWLKQGLYKETLQAKTVISLVGMLEKSYLKLFNSLLGDPHKEKTIDREEVLKKYNLTALHAGESFDNIMKISWLVENHPDIKLFVQVNPAFCCAGQITEGLESTITKVTGVPVVSISYDGTEKLRNSVVIPYIKYPRV
ncbi:CoA activase [bacterium]|nr:CoA activase [bacterium]